MKRVLKVFGESYLMFFIIANLMMVFPVIVGVIPAANLIAANIMLIISTGVYAYKFLKYNEVGYPIALSVAAYLKFISDIEATIQTITGVKI